MKKILAAAFIAAFAASPLLACEMHKDTTKSETKAELKTPSTSSGRATRLKTAKASKSAKPLAEGKTTDKKI